MLKIHNNSRFLALKRLFSSASPCLVKDQQIEHLKQMVQKLKTLPIEIETKYLDKQTLTRLASCSDSFVIDLVNNLNTYDIKSKYMSNILRTHDDWNLLTRGKLNEIIDMLRSVSFKKEVYLSVISQNKLLLNTTEPQLVKRLDELKGFFNKQHLERILLKSSQILTEDIDSIRYKFTYLFALMGIEQKEMMLSSVFSYSINFIRERHLFLLRTAFFDKPNKKGLTKIENPRLYNIIDSNLNDYLRICTKDMFTVSNYETFCEYLKQQNFDDELLGLRIGKQMQDQIIESIKIQKNDDFKLRKEEFQKY
jgi:hypothetical protein